MIELHAQGAELVRAAPAPDLMPAAPPPARHPRRRSAPADPVTLLDFSAGRWQLLDGSDLPGGAHAWITHAAAPSLRATPAAVAEMIVARYRDLQSLDSQTAALNAAGIAMTRLRLMHWTASAVERLVPIAAAIAETGRRAPLLAAANMAFGLPYAAWSRLWVYRSSPSGGAISAGAPALTWMRVTPDRIGGYAMQELEGFTGLLQAPTAAGYDRIARDNRWPLLGCWDQLYERAYELQRRSGHPFLARLFDLVAALRAIEQRIAAAGHHGRQAVRQRESRPLIESFEHEMARLRFAVEPLSPIGEFVTDLWARWGPLTQFVDDGRIDLENVATRRARELLTSANRWPFGRHRDSRNSAATVYTVIETCAMNGVDPRHYLGAILACGDPGKLLKNGESLLPWQFADALPQTLRS